MKRELKLWSPNAHEARADARPLSGLRGVRKRRNIAESVHRHLFLLGRPELSDFLRYVENHAVDLQDEQFLIREWDSARRVIEKLEKTEAGAADGIHVTALPITPENEPLLVEFLKDPLIRSGFNTVPTEVAMVELDRMIVFQKHIDLTHVEEIKKRIGPTPSEEQIFRTCLPFDHPKPPVKWSRMRRDTYVFVSPSNDLRFLSTMPLDPEKIVDHDHPGTLVGMIGAGVGFGSNFLNATYMNKRLFLNNGSHRAYALRDLGITHVPCIVQHVSSMDEMEVVDSSDIVDEPEYYLRHPRPAMFKDYFNPDLRKVMAVHRRLRQIIVKIEVTEGNIPAL